MTATSNRGWSLVAGVGWVGDRYRMEVVDRAGRAVFKGGYRVEDWRRLTIDLSTLQATRNRSVVCVIDTRSGILEHELLETGWPTLRADPTGRAAIGTDGSTEPRELALRGLLEPDTLRPLTQTEGGLVGRDGDLKRARRGATAAVEDADSPVTIVEHGQDGAAAIALTFDDGPHESFTPPILDVLDRYQVPATFFCLGLRLRASPHVARRIVDDGHLVGNHTWSHPFLPDLTPAEIDYQLTETSQAVKGVTGDEPAYFRPSYGGYDLTTLNRTARLGMTTVLWDVDPHDWSGCNSTTIRSEVCDQASAGSIVLLHDGGGNRTATVEALPGIIEFFLDRDMTLVTVDSFR